MRVVDGVARSAVNLLKRKLLIPSDPSRFNFEVTRKCGGRCGYCNIWKNTETRRNGCKHDSRLPAKDVC